MPVSRSLRPSLTILAGILIAAPLSATAEEAVAMAACTSGPSLSGEARERFDAEALIAVAGFLEGQGEANFHLEYSRPASECLVESFTVADTRVDAIYSPFEKGDSTLIYRFKVHRPAEESEILVIYSGLASLVVEDGYVVHVSEERQGVISWYAVYRDDPPYPVVKDLATKIVEGSATPLMAVRWPKGAKEGEAISFDGDRLK